MPSEPQRRGRRWGAARLLRAVGLSLTFAGASVVGVVVHVDLPVGRRLTAHLVERALSNVLEGKILIAPFSHLGLTHFTVPRLTLLDATGRQVAVLTDVHVDVSLVSLATDLLFGKGPPSIVVDHVRAERSDVELVTDPGSSEPSIVRAVRPKKTAGARPASSGDQGGPSVHLRDAELGRVTVHLLLPNEPPAEARLRHVAGKLDASSKGLSIDVARFGVTLRGAGQIARGTGTFTARVPGAVSGTFHGFLGDVELSAKAVLDGRHVELVANVPRARPAATLRVLPGWPLVETITAHAEVSGELPNLQAHATARAGASTIVVDGPVTTDGDPSAKLVVTGRHLDARAFSLDAPATDVALDATVDGRLNAGRIEARLTGHTAATVIAGQPVPPVTTDATWEKNLLRGTFEAREPGMPVAGSFRVSDAGVADLDARVDHGDVSRITRLHTHGAKGKGHARIRAHLEKGEFRASLDAEVSGVVVGSATLDGAHVTAEAKGPLSAPSRIAGTVHVEGTNVTVNGVTAARLVADAHGGRDGLHFDARAGDGDESELHVTGLADLFGAQALRDVDVSFRRSPVTIEGHVAALNLNASDVDVQHISVTGAGGQVTGSVRVHRDLLEVKAEGQNVDLAAIGRALGLPRGKLEGTLRVDANLATGRDVTRGHVRLGLRNGTVGPVGGASLQLSADLDGRSVKGSAAGLVAGFGTFGATWDGALRGRPLDASSWTGATGTAEVQIGDVKLALLNPLLPKSSPVDHVGGQAFGRFLFDRKTERAPLPDVSATVATQNLGLELSTGSSKSRVEGVALTATGTLDGTTGDVTASTRAADAQGALVAASGSIKADLERWLRSPAEGLAELLNAPLQMTVSVPKRSLAMLPDVVRPEGLTGAVSANVQVQGTVAHPVVSGAADAFQVGTEGGRRPIDVHADARYDVTTHAVGASVTASLAGHSVADGKFDGALPNGAASWAGSGRLELRGMPVDLLGALATSHTNGQLFGDVTWSRTGTTGTIGADVRMAGMQVNREPLGDGQLHVETTGDIAHATLHFAGKTGALDANGTAPLSFRTAVPAIGRDAPVRAHLTAHDFNAASLSPLVTGVLTRVGGRFDADVGLELTPTSGAEDGWSGGVQGRASINHGSVLIDALGLEVRDLSGSATARGSGINTTLSIRDVRGRVRSAKDNLRASADLVLEGIRLMHGTATLDADELPVLFQGAPQGRITGETTAKITRRSDRMDVDVQIPSLVAQLPQSSTRQVISLNDDKDVSVVQFERAHVAPSDVTPWRFSLHLGNDVSLKRQDIELFVSGSPVIDLDDEAHLSGTIDVAPGGRVPVLGKVFIVEHGRVIFDTGDTSNPRLDVTAAWRAPDDTMVYVDLTGPLHDLSHTIRSDPPLPDADVYALLLGGAPQESTTTTDTSQENAGAAAGATALGGGVAALGLNQLIANNPVEVRVDTTSQSLPRYTAAVRVRPNLWFEASQYQQTDFGAGGATDRTVFSGTVDYRFTKRWSLRTEAGTAGGALDLLWQYRY